MDVYFHGHLGSTFTKIGRYNCQRWVRKFWPWHVPFRYSVGFSIMKFCLTFHFPPIPRHDREWVPKSSQRMSTMYIHRLVLIKLVNSFLPDKDKYVHTSENNLTSTPHRLCSGKISTVSLQERQHFHAKLLLAQHKHCRRFATRYLPQDSRQRRSLES